VLSPKDLKKRIGDNRFSVLVAIYNNKIIGTASFQYRTDFLYLSSMAVDPKYQNMGVGNFLLYEIQKEAICRSCSLIKLDSYYPLK
jgi:N-acetylglutamate synthase-like GNAT family acetyltransferase